MMKDMKKSIGGLKGAEVSLFFHDSQFIEGTLIAVKEDHLVVEVNKHVYYIALKQVYGISKNTKDNRVYKKIPPFIDKNLLTDVLNSMKYNIITINAMYNKLLVGLLISISEDCIMLVNQNELHLIDNSSIFNVFDGNYEQEKIQGDITRELGTTVKHNTQQLVETPAILIHLNFEPLQDKIAESSFLEKNPSSTEENVIDELLLEKKATELSITENVVLKSGGDTPVSSHIEAMEETELDKPQEKVEPKDNSLSGITEAELILNDKDKENSKGNVNLNLLAPNIAENEKENKIEMLDFETKENIEEDFIQQPKNEEIGDSHIFHKNENEKLQPQSHIIDKNIDIESRNTKEIDEEIISDENEILQDKNSAAINVREGLLAIESFHIHLILDQKELNKDSMLPTDQKNNINLIDDSHSLMNAVRKPLPKSNLSGTLMNKKFYLVEPLSKHKLKQTLGQENIFPEANTYSYCSMEQAAAQKNILAIPCQTRFLEEKFKSDTLQVENHESSMDEKMLFEAQYFALMKHAERMLDTIESSESCVKNINPEGKVIIKNQYLSLFKSSKKMYNRLKEERNKKLI